MYVTADLQLDFGASALTWDPVAQGRLARAVDQVRSWCGFQFALVTGHADPSETDTTSLAELSIARAMYVVQLLGTLGVPKERTFSEGKGASQPLPGWSGRVEIDLQGEGNGDRGCSIPPDGRGFRARPL